jgi:hypothetical protein
VLERDVVKLQASLDEATRHVKTWQRLQPSADHHGPSYVERDAFLAAQPQAGGGAK